VEQIQPRSQRVRYVVQGAELLMMCDDLEEGSFPAITPDTERGI